jgi:hypothetical protein
MTTTILITLILQLATSTIPKLRLFEIVSPISVFLPGYSGHQSIWEKKPMGHSKLPNC